MSINKVWDIILTTDRISVKQNKINCFSYIKLVNWMHSIV